jgi:hypothetical protein
MHTDNMHIVIRDCLHWPNNIWMYLPDTVICIYWNAKIQPICFGGERGVLNISHLAGRTRNVCITKYARLYKLSNGIMVMTPK